jgi:hypothetical protein
MILTYEVTCTDAEIKLNPESDDYGWFSWVPFNSVYDYSEYLKKKIH